MAALFALQYAWNIRWLVAEHPNAAVADLARAFWFDVTKSDWRATMVYGIPTSTIADRFAMYWFDVRQQFGIPGAAAAVVGFAALLRRQWRAGAMLLTLWLVTWVFAFTYNVGDVHVFYLGSHWAAALAAGCGAGWAVSALQARGRQAGRCPRRRSPSSPTRPGGPGTPALPWTAATTGSRRWRSIGWSPASTRAGRCWDAT